MKVGTSVLVSFPERQPERGTIVQSWDNSWYHIFFIRAVDGIQEQIVERARLIEVSDPQAVHASSRMRSRARPSGRLANKPFPETEIRKTQHQKPEPGALSVSISVESQLFPTQEQLPNTRAAIPAILEDNHDLNVDGDVHGGQHSDADFAANFEDLKRELDKSQLLKRKVELDRLHARLLKEKNKLQSLFKVSFPVDPEHIEYVIGRNGSNISRAEAIPNVNRIDVKDFEVTITARTFEAAESARDLLEFVLVDVPVTPKERSLMIGKGGKNVRDLQAKAGLAKLEIDARGNVLLLGCRKAVAMGKKILDLITRFLLEQEALQEANREFLGQDDSAWPTDEPTPCDEVIYEDCYTFSEDGCAYFLKVPEEKLGVLIGFKGATIREMRERTGCQVEVVKDAFGSNCVAIGAGQVDAADEAAAWVRELVTDPPPGSVHEGSVVRLADYGTYVAFGRREGLLPANHVGAGRLAAGDTVRVRVAGQDERGRIRLALEDAPEPRGPPHAAARPSSAAARPPPAVALKGANLAAAGSARAVHAPPPKLQSPPPPPPPPVDAGQAGASGPWPALGAGVGEAEGGVGQYAAWYQRIKDQRERARSEAEVRRTRDEHVYSGHTDAGMAGAAKGRSVPAGAGTTLNNTRGGNAGTSSTVKLSSGSGTSAVSRGGLPEGSTRVVTASARSDAPRVAAATAAAPAQSASVSTARDRFKAPPQPLRRAGGDTDYIRDYTRYAPAPGAAGGGEGAEVVGFVASGAAAGQVRVARLTDRDGGEEGGAASVGGTQALGARERGREKDRR